VIAIGILVGSASIPDALVEERPKLDRALLWAVDLALIVFGVPQSSSWGWAAPRIGEWPRHDHASGGQLAHRLAHPGWSGRAADVVGMAGLPEGPAGDTAVRSGAP
jgi:hypothetical protein